MTALLMQVTTNPLFSYAAELEIQRPYAPAHWGV